MPTLGSNSMKSLNLYRYFILLICLTTVCMEKELCTLLLHYEWIKWDECYYSYFIATPIDKDNCSLKYLMRKATQVYQKAIDSLKDYTTLFQKYFNVRCYQRPPHWQCFLEVKVRYFISTTSNCQFSNVTSKLVLPFYYWDIRIYFFQSLEHITQ